MKKREERRSEEGGGEGGEGGKGGKDIGKGRQRDRRGGTIRRGQVVR